MRANELLAKAIEIREAAGKVSQPALRSELLSLADRFDALALGSRPGGTEGLVGPTGIRPDDDRSPSLEPA